MSVVPNLAVGTSVAQGVLIEAFITCSLVLSVLFLAVEKHKATFLAPVGISITLFACHLFVSYLNPIARLRFNDKNAFTVEGSD
jgi:aquaporin related protein